LKNLGVDLKEEEINKAFVRFKSVADKKKQVYDEDLLAIVEDEAKVYEKMWTLDTLSAKSGTNIETEVRVGLQSKGQLYHRMSTGDGPVDACYKAIESITKIKSKLLDYSIQSVTQGKDALGEVTIKVKIKSETVIAHGTSTDILEASAKAFINAINKVLSLRDKSLT